MLTINVLGDENWDSEEEKFVYTNNLTLEFEHSLVSVSKWESIHHKPFLTNDKKSEDEMASYMFCMLLTPGVAPNELSRLSVEQVQAIADYVNDPMTGTTVTELPQNRQKSSERLSAELIYFWMSQYQIPVSCESWHLNRLFTLIKVHYAKAQKPKKMSKTSHAQRMAELNAARKKQMGTSG